MHLSVYYHEASFFVIIIRSKFTYACQSFDEHNIVMTSVCEWYIKENYEDIYSGCSRPGLEDP